MAIKFIDVLGRTLPRSRFLELCDKAGLTDDEKLLLSLRCCELKTQGQIEGAKIDNKSDMLTLRRQKVLIPMLENKLWLWYILFAQGFLKDQEITAITKACEKYKLNISPSGLSKSPTK